MFHISTDNGIEIVNKESLNFLNEEDAIENIIYRDTYSDCLLKIRIDLNTNLM